MKKYVIEQLEFFGPKVFNTIDDAEFFLCRHPSDVLGFIQDSQGVTVGYVDDGNHTNDEDCILDENDTCLICGVWHAETCPECGRRGFHRDGCTWNNW